MFAYFFVIVAFLLLEGGLVGGWIACRVFPALARYQSLSTHLLVWCSTAFVVGNVSLWLVTTGIEYIIYHTTWRQNDWFKLGVLAIVLVGPLVTSLLGPGVAAVVAVVRYARGQ